MLFDSSEAAELTILMRNYFRASFACVCAESNCAKLMKFPVLQFSPSDDIDPYKQVKQGRNTYTELLENIIMEQRKQQRKQFQAVNDEEFSDEVNKEEEKLLSGDFHNFLFTGRSQ